MYSLQINDVSHFNSVTWAYRMHYFCIWAFPALSGSATAWTYFILITFQYMKLNESK